MTSASPKRDFGTFVAARRRATGLTQRSLAQQLFVSESAVSKWERGLSYPDISILTSLAEQLGVSERELLRATEDHIGRRVEREARVYRRWKAWTLWSTSVGYALAVLVCLVVNVAVAHTVDWFWVVLAAVAVAASVTTLPLLPLPCMSGQRRGWIVLAGFLAGLFGLFTATWLLDGRGRWLPVAIVSVLFAAVLVLGPVLLRQVYLPAGIAAHRTVLVLSVDTLALCVLLLVVSTASEDLHTYVARSLPIAGLAVVFVWAPALVIRYLRVPPLFRVAIGVAVVAVYEFAFAIWLIPMVTDGRTHVIDLRDWNQQHLDGNICLMVALGLLLASAVVAAVAVARMGQDGVAVAPPDPSMVGSIDAPGGARGSRESRL